MVLEQETVARQLFGEKNGQPISIYKIRNKNGFQVSCIDYGCIITEILAQDLNGEIQNVVLGFDTLEEYERDVHFLGAVAGRFAGRIKDGDIEIEGQRYQLGCNSNGHHLHGGAEGFHSVIWHSAPFEEPGGAGVEFTYTSLDGEEGYPGTLEMKVRYFVWSDSDELIISYEGTADQTTLLNPTNHTYFNLSGDLQRDVLDHEIHLPADTYLELDDALLPTGNMLLVEGTVFDLRDGAKIRTAAEADHPQSKLAGGGFDHPFVLDQNRDPLIQLCDPASGRILSVATTEPAVVFYTGNGLGGPYKIRGTAAKDHLGLCLETQNLPDSPHHPNFEPALLKAGERYQSETRFIFGVGK